MPYPIDSGAIAELHLEGVLDGQKIINVFHYRLDEAQSDGGGVLADMMSSFETLVWTEIRDAISPDYGQALITGQWVYPTRYVRQTRTPANRNGAFVAILPGGSVASDPSGVSMVVRRTTFQAGRKYRGRIYLAGVPISAVAGSQLETGYRNTFDGPLETLVASDLVATITANAYPVIWSYSAPTRSTRIVAGLLDPIVRYQRRREVGVGV